MSINLDNFNDSDYFNSDKTLKENCLVFNNFFSGFSANLMIMTIVIFKDLSFEIKLIWYKYPIKNRLYSIYKCNFTPNNITKIIERLSKMENVKLKEDYSTYTGKYIPEDVSHDSLYYNHLGKTLSLNMSTYLMNDKKLFETKQEKAFLELHKELRKWSELLYERITAIHE